MFGNKMVVFGFASSQGQIRAIRMKDGKFTGEGPLPITLTPVLKESAEAMFKETGLPRFILPFRNIKPGSALGKWLAQTHPHRMPGATYDPSRDAQQYITMSLPKAFDAIIYIENSTAAKPL
jgi:erythromycin esterase-like protein